MSAPQAVAFLRRRTLGRATKGYIAWIGRAVGWATILYLLFWLVVFFISGLQLLNPLDAPVAPIAPVAAALTALAALATPFVSRVPPIVLGRRDVYRLALAPVSPWLSARWPFTVRWLGLGLLGLLLGGVWTLASPYWTLAPAPWAGPALALLLIAWHNLRWLAYAERELPLLQRSSLALALGAALLALLALVAPEVSPASAFHSASPVSLLLPLLLALHTFWRVRVSLRDTFPPRFAAQSFVLSELQAARTLSVLAALAGSGAVMEAGERRHLLEVLHDRPGAIRPKRSLPLPRPSWPQWVALAWRSGLALYRRSLWDGLWLLGLVAAVGATSLMDLQGGVAAFIAALLFGRTCALLLGPDLSGRTLPIDPQTRTLGRVMPGAVIATAGIVLTSLAFLMAGLAVTPTSLAILLTLPLLNLGTLEKYSARSQLPPSRTEAWAVAALIAWSPVLILGGLGVPELIVPAQLFLTFLLLVLPL
jgi:hypothetical protein